MAGSVCWFERSGTVGGSGSQPITWAATTDGVQPFFDAAVDTEDASVIRVVNGGAWHMDITAVIHPGDVASYPMLTVALNDDSAGPLYDLIDQASLTVDANERRSLGFGFDYDFADGDTLRFTVTGMDPDATVASAVLTARRLGDLP